MQHLGSLHCHLSLNRSTGGRPCPPLFRRPKRLDHKTVAATTDSFTHRLRSHKRLWGAGVPPSHKDTPDYDSHDSWNWLSICLSWNQNHPQTGFQKIGPHSRENKNVGGETWRHPIFRGCYPTTVRKIGVWQSNRDSTNILSDRCDSRCILELGSLYNTGNHPERLPMNRFSHSAAHVSQFSCSKPSRRGVRLLLPNTHQATTITNCFTIPTNWRQPSRSPELDTRQIPIQHFQHLRMPKTPSDGRPAVGTPRQPRGQADRRPQIHSSRSTLATGSESVYRQRGQTRGSGGCPSWRTSYLVPSNGHGSEEKRQATTHSGHAGAQQTCSPWNTSNPIPVSPGDAGTFRDQEDDYRCLERVPQCANPKRRSPPHHVHHAMGSVPIQNLSTGLRCFTGRIHQKIRRDCQWLPQQNQMHRWHMIMGRHSRRELLSNMSLARHLRSTRNCSESRNICICLRRGGICWFRHHSDRYPAQWQTHLRNPWLSYATKHHWHPNLVWPHQPSIVLRLPPQWHGAFPRASQAVVNVLLGWWAATCFWAIQGCYTEQNHRGCPDIPPQTCYMSRHRLVQEKHLFLALAEIVHLWGHHSYLLLNGMENSVRW